MRPHPGLAGACSLVRAILPLSRAASMPLALLAAMAAAPPGLAAAQAWIPLGPNGGSLREIAQSPGAPEMMYAVASGGGIWKSTNHGRDWQLAGDALNGRDVQDLAVDPNDPSVLYASVIGLGMEKSTDAAASWRPANTGLPAAVPFVLTIAVDPGDSRTVYAGTLNGPYKSTDGGATWTPPRGAIAQQWVYALVIDPTDSRAVYAGGYAGGFFKSGDGGATWVASNAGLPPDTPVFDIAADPSAAGTLYVTDLQQVFRSDDGGASWQSGARGAMDHLAVAPNGWLFGLSRTDVSRSTDRGATWASTAVASQPAPEHGRALIADPASPGLIFAAVGSGLLASPNHGATWRSGSRGLTATVVEKVAIGAGSPPTVFASVDGLGVVESRAPVPGVGGRATWLSVNGDLAPRDQFAGTALAVDRRHPANLWRGAYFGVAQSADGGATWTAAGIPDGCLIALAIAVDPARSGTVYVGGTAYEHFCDTVDAHSWKTTNGGVSWQNLPVEPQALVLDPTHPGLLYGLNGALGRSADGGLTWQDVTPGGAGTTVYGLALDPLRTATLYGATGEGVFKSTNGGRTWRAAGHGLPAGKVTGIAVDPRRPANVFAVVVTSAGGPAGGAAGEQGAAGVYLSTDGAGSWSPYSAGLPARAVTELVSDPADPGNLYALTGGYGLYRLNLGAPTP